VATLKRQEPAGRPVSQAASPRQRERRSVAQEVTQLLSEALESPRRLSILELRGLGKEYWEHTDAAAHVERERAAWD